MEEGTIVDPKIMLDKLRGCDKLCGCGKELIPAFYKGKRTGVIHKTYEDDEHHMNFWAGLKLEIIK